MKKTLSNKTPVTPRRLREQDLPRDKGRAFGDLRKELVLTFRNTRHRTDRMIELGELLAFMLDNVKSYLDEEFDHRLHNAMVEIEAFTEQEALDQFAESRYGVKLDGREKLETMKEKLANIVQDTVLFHKTFSIKTLEKVDLTGKLAEKKALAAAQVAPAANVAVAKPIAAPVAPAAKVEAKVATPATTAPTTAPTTTAPATKETEIKTEGK